MNSDSEPGHGNSPAAWTGVIIMLVGFAVGTFAFWFDLSWLVFAGVAVVVLGAVTGLVLSKLGYGVGGDRLAPKSNQ